MRFRSISPIITTIILVVIAVGLTTSTYIFLSGTISKLSESLTHKTQQTTRSIVQCSMVRGDIIVYAKKPQNISYYFADFRYRVPITIQENSRKDLADYQVLVTVNTQALISAGKMRSDCGDIRFTYVYPNGTEVKIPYWIKPNTCNTQNTNTWIKVPFIPANSNVTVYMYYGNSSATSESMFWNNITHLNIYGGVFDYDISQMQRRTGKIVSVASVSYHTCVLTFNGNVICYWGGYYDYYPDYGQVQNYAEGDAIGIATGAYHTCILTSSGNVICYGYNGYGQANNYTRGDAIGIATGVYHTCVLTSNGNVICYGYVRSNYTRGDAIGVAAGGFSTSCILTSNGNVICYRGGFNYTGGDAIGVAAGPYGVCVITSSRNVICYVNGYYYSYTGRDALGAITNYDSYCVLTFGGNLVCYPTCWECAPFSYWGGNIYNPSRKYTFPEPSYTLGQEENIQLTQPLSSEPSLVINLINTGPDLGNTFKIRITYIDGRTEYYIVTLNQTLSSGSMASIPLYNLTSGMISNIKIYSLDVCQNSLIVDKYVNVEV